MKADMADCPLCGPAPSRLLFKGPDVYMLIPGEFPLVVCRTCGLVYIYPRPSSQELERHYPPHYWTTPEQAPGLDAVGERAVKILTERYPGGSVLDVGCGLGKKTAALRDRGLNAVGLEPYEHACETARKHYGLEVVCSTLQEAPFPDNSFDAVTLFEVLEHVPDPVGDLRRIHALLKPGGSVCVKVPNLAAFQARMLGRWWHQLDVPRHLQDFSPRSLRYGFAQAGFKDVWCKAPPDPWGKHAFEFSLLLWLRWLQLSRSNLPIAPASGETLSESLEGKVYSGVTPAAKRAFRWILRRVLYFPLSVENLVGRSISLLAITRK
ncbi:MAG: class I SAM-dependent methyltransferase [Armatimonadetes bacterium]|nr:class I SAM-dependent methyltransferase [Armatimonadota bacterium]